MKKQSMVFIFEHPPHSSLSAKEGLDFALASCAFEQDVSVIFMGDGIFQLINGQNTETLNLKNHSLGIDALSLYGIEKCFYADTDREHRQVSVNELSSAAAPLNEGAIEEYIKTADQVFIY